MGTRGPAATPNHTLRLRGSPLGNRNPTEPQPESGEPVRNVELGGDAQIAWDYVCGHLDQMGLLKQSDGQALVRYCHAWSRWVECMRFVDKHGSTYPVKDKSGAVLDLKEFPESRLYSRLSTELLRMEQHFGLTPSARARLTAMVTGNDADNRGKERYFRTA